MDKVKNRFDNEVLEWDNKYKKPPKSIIPKSIIDEEIRLRSNYFYNLALDLYKKKWKISVLEIWCWTWRNISRIKSISNDIKAVWVDISENMIKFCKEKYNNIDFYVLDICNWFLEEQFDLIILPWVVWYLPNNKKAFENISSMQKKWWILSFTYWDKTSIPRIIREKFLNWPNYLVLNKTINFLRKILLKRKDIIKKWGNNSYFNLYDTKYIENLYKSNYKLIDSKNLCYSSWIFWKFSIFYSRVLNKVLFWKFSRLALTKILTLKKIDE